MNFGKLLMYAGSCIICIFLLYSFTSHGQGKNEDIQQAASPEAPSLSIQGNIDPRESTSVVREYRLEYLLMTKTKKNRYSFYARTQPIDFKIPFSKKIKRKCKELEFIFKSLSPIDPLSMRLEGFKFKVKNSEMYAINLPHSNSNNLDIKGLLSIKDNYYPHNSGRVKNKRHIAFSKKFSIETLSLKRQDSSAIFTLGVRVKYKPKGTFYRVSSCSVVYDTKNSVYTVVLSVAQSDSGRRELKFRPLRLLVYNHSSTYSGRPGGLPSRNCKQADAIWNNTDGISIIIIDAAEHASGINWENISVRKANLCFK